jgi:hypothetical protein
VLVAGEHTARLAMETIECGEHLADGVAVGRIA